jgi:hypothetical protein
VFLFSFLRCVVFSKLTGAFVKTTIPM